jgi:hypothetical protein
MEGSLPLPVNPLVALLTLRRTDILSGVHGSLLGNRLRGDEDSPDERGADTKEDFLAQLFHLFPSVAPRRHNFPVPVQGGLPLCRAATAAVKFERGSHSSLIAANMITGRSPPLEESQDHAP